MSQPSINPYGAVDLAALAQRAPTRPPAGAGAAPGGSYVVDVTDATFGPAVAQRSMTVPVVVDLWATWCEPCKQLSPVLERLADAYAGRFVLAKVDVDANPQIAQAFQVQSIPMVAAVIGGRALPLFQGALPEAQVRQYLDQLLQAAAAAGVDGVAEPVEPGGPPGPQEPPAVDPRFEAAFEAIERGDLDGAAQAYRAVLAQAPADVEAKAGLAQVELLRRIAGVDPRAVRRAAAARPDDVAAQCAAADVDLAAGQVADAFARLVDAVRRSAGDDREQARRHLVELFELVDPADPRLAAARLALANALF